MRIYSRPLDGSGYNAHYVYYSSSNKETRFVVQFNMGLLSIINSNETFSVTKTDANGTVTQVNETKPRTNYYNNDRYFS